MSGVGMIAEAVTSGLTTAASVAREVGGRLTGAMALNATLHWSQALLDRQATALDALSPAERTTRFGGKPSRRSYVR